MRVLERVDVFGGDLEHFVERLVRIEHHHRRHELGDGSDGRGLVSVAREERVPVRRIVDEHAGGLHVGLAVLGELRGGDVGARLDHLVRRVRGKGQHGNQEEGKKTGHFSLSSVTAGDTIANITCS